MANVNASQEVAEADDGICATTSCPTVVTIYSVVIFFVMLAIFMTAAMNISGITR